MKSALPLFLLLLGSIGAALAHEDPRGEVRPLVTIDGDHFKVTFSDNTLATSQAKSRTFSRTGKLIAEQPEKTENPLFRKYSFPQLTEELSGLERRFNESWLVIPEYPRKHGGTPFLVLISGDTVSYKSLTWGLPNVDLVQDALIDGNSLYLLVTRTSSAGKVTLWLSKFSLTSFKEEAFVQLADPCSIYSFPICSNLINYNHRLYLAIAADRPRGAALQLASWNGVDPSATTSNVTTSIDWNTHISIANIEDDLLIAYHYPGAQEGLLASFFPSQSKILIRHLKLGASMFAWQPIIWSVVVFAIVLTCYYLQRRRRRDSAPRIDH